MNTIKVYDYHGRQVFHCPELEIDFHRLAAGFSWPAAGNPGTIVVLGETRDFDPILGISPCYWLLEAEELDTMKLIVKCGEFVRSYFLTAVFANTFKQDNMRLLSEYNRTCQQQKQKPLYLQPAPFTTAEGSISYHLGILLDRLDPTKRSLYLSNDSRLKSALLDIQIDERDRATEMMFPVVAALAYGVTGLASTVTNPYENNSSQQPIKDYDIFDYHFKQGGFR